MLVHQRVAGKKKTGTKNAKQNRRRKTRSLAMAPSHSEVRGHRPTRSLRSTGRTKVCWNPNEPGVLAWENSGKIQGKFMMLICLP